MTFQIAITYLANQRERRAIHSVLGDISEIFYLPGLKSQERTAALGKADVIVSRSFAETEITVQDVAHLKSARLIQLIFAGADKIPFAAISDNITVASNAGAFATPLAEHALAMTLCLAKSLLPRHLQLVDGNFNQSEYGKELRGGKIGRAHV